MSCGLWVVGRGLWVQIVGCGLLLHIACHIASIRNSTLAKPLYLGRLLASQSSTCSCSDALIGTFDLSQMPRTKEASYLMELAYKKSDSAMASKSQIMQL
jgi:hypothetical protein